MIFKRLTLLILAMLALVIPAAAQQDGTSNTITFSEAQVNDAIAHRLSVTGRDVTATADLKDGEVDLKLSGTGPRGQAFDLTVVIVPSVDDAGQVIWTPADLVLTDDQGNPITAQNAENVIINLEDVIISSFRAAMRDQMGSLPRRPQVASITVTEDAITLELVSGKPGAGDNGSTPPGDAALPPNVTRNDDGTLSIHISQSQMNDVLARIAARRDAIDAMTAEMTDGLLTLSVTAPGACDGTIEATFVASDPDNGDAFTPQSVSCDGQTMTQTNNIIGVLIALLVDFGHLQARTATLVNVQIVPGELIFTVQPPARQTSS